MQYQSQVRKVGAKLSCVDVVLDMDRRYALIPHVFFNCDTCPAQHHHAHCVAWPAEHHHIKMYLVQASVFYANYWRRTRLKLYVKFSLFILLRACERSAHRKLIRGTSYQLSLKGSLTIEKIHTGIHGIHYIWRKNVYYLSAPPCPSLSPSI